MILAYLIIEHIASGRDAFELFSYSLSQFPITNNFVTVYPTDSCNDSERTWNELCNNRIPGGEVFFRVSDGNDYGVLRILDRLLFL